MYESYNVDPLTLAAERAVRAGIVVVAAAGNNGRNAAGHTQYGGITSPGNAPWVLTVGASSHMGTVDRGDDTIASFTSRGPTAIDRRRQARHRGAGRRDRIALRSGQLVVFIRVRVSAGWHEACSRASVSQPQRNEHVRAGGERDGGADAAGRSHTDAEPGQSDPAVHGGGLPALRPVDRRCWIRECRGARRIDPVPGGTSTGTYPDSSRWGRRLIWGNRLVKGGRLAADANAWPTDVTWGATTANGATVSWGARCASEDCTTTGGQWRVDNGYSRNVVWGWRCGGSDCGEPWTPDVVNSTDGGETVVWGTDDGETVVWGTDERRNSRVGHILSGSELHAGRLGQVMTTSTMDVRAADAGQLPVGGRRGALSWKELSSTAHVYVLTVIVAGACAVVAWFPSDFSDPWLFALLLVTSCLTSLWKLNLPIPLASGSTLSVSYAANLMALLLLGPRHALIIALAGVWTQCTVRIKQPYPWYQTTFSLAGEALTMVATGVRLPVARRPPAAGRILGSGPAAGRGDHDVFHRQHRARRRGDRHDDQSKSLGGLAHGVFVERCQLHGGGRGGRGGCGGHRARRALDGRPDDRAGVSDLQDVSGVHRPSARTGIATPPKRAGCTGDDRRAVARASGGARAGVRKGPSRGHGRGTDAPRGRPSRAARARAHRARERRGRQQAEGSVPGDGVARAADAAERHPGLGGHAADACDRRGDARARLPIHLRQRATAGADD